MKEINSSSEKTKRALVTAGRGSAISFAGILVGKVLAFILRLVVIRLLGTKYFGFFALSMSVVEFVRLFSSIGLAKGGMRFLARSLDDDTTQVHYEIFKTTVTVPCILSLFFGALLYISARLIAVHWFHNPDFSRILQLFALSVPSITLLRVGGELSRGFCTTRYAVLVENFIVPAIQLILFIMFYWFFHDFNALIFAYIISVSIGGVLIFYFTLSQLRMVWIVKDQTVKHLVKMIVKSRINKRVIGYSFPLFLSGITAILMGSIDILMLGRYFDAEIVGVYSAVAMVAILLSSTLVIPVTSIFAPLIARHQGQKDMAVVASLYTSATRWLCFVSILTFAAAVLYRDFIMQIFGSEFFETGPLILLILIPGHFVVCLTGCAGQLLAMTGHQKKELAISIAVVMMNITLNLFLIPVYGAIGAAIATSASMTFVNLLRVAIVCYVFNIQPVSMKLIWLIGVATIFVTAGGILQNYMTLLQGILIASIVCLFLVWFIFYKNMENDDMEMLSKIGIKFRLLQIKHFCKGR